MEEYPEYCKWTCCGSVGNEEGCKIGRHKEKLARKDKPAPAAPRAVERNPYPLSSEMGFSKSPINPKSQITLVEAVKPPIRSRFVPCTRCHDEFNPSLDFDGSCKYHPGE